MFTVVQSVTNNTGAPVALHPSPARPARLPAGDGRLLHPARRPAWACWTARCKDPSYANGEGRRPPSMTAWRRRADHRRLDRDHRQILADRGHPRPGDAGDGDLPPWQVRHRARPLPGRLHRPPRPLTVAPGAQASRRPPARSPAPRRCICWRYEDAGHIPLFSYAVDFGWFWFLTKPIFYALDWLNGVLGNFGVAIMVFTVFAKAAVLPAGEQILPLDEQDEAARPEDDGHARALEGRAGQAAVRDDGLYKAEKVNPAAAACRCWCRSRCSSRSTR